MTLWEAIRTAHKLKDTPVSTKTGYFGEHRFIEGHYLIYNRARNTIYSKNKVLHKVLSKLNII